MTNDMLNLSKSEMDFVIELASVRACSLEVKPGNKDNWIESVGGGLPNYVCVVAKGIMKSGKSRSASIAIAISRIKRWAAGGGGVNADTRAKAVKALAQWTALRAKAKAKKLIKASGYLEGDYLILSEVDSYSLDNVRDAWDAYMREVREAYTVYVTDPNSPQTEDSVPYSWVREVWSDYIIVEVERPRHYLKVPYMVEDGVVIFSIPEEVEQVWAPKK